MKNIRAFPLVAVMGFMALGASMSLAQTLTNGDWIYRLNGSNEATITGYKGAGGEITIPSEIGDHVVRYIGSRAFAGAQNATSVIIPETVTSIGGFAFVDCGQITNIPIPNNVTNIGSVAFAKTGIRHMTIPDGVTIGDSLFLECRNLQSVVMPTGMTTIPLATFQGCTSLSNIAFSPNAAIPGTVIIPETVTSIEGWAFSECRRISNVILPTNITTVAARSFANCTTLEGTLFLGNAPANESNDIFTGSPNVIVYYLQGKTGWGSTFSGRQTAPFNANLALGYGLMEITKSPNNFSLYSSSQYDQNRTNGQSDVTTNPSAFNLYTKSQFDGNRAAGQQDVISNPMSYGLYTTDSIMDLRMGGLMIQKQGADAMVVFQPQTTTDLATQPFTNNGTPITNTIPMPGDKGFLRIQAR
jgi:hypothetical protein